MGNTKRTLRRIIGIALSIVFAIGVLPANSLKSYAATDASVTVNFTVIRYSLQINCSVCGRTARIAIILLPIIENAVFCNRYPTTRCKILMAAVITQQHIVV